MSSKPVLCLVQTLVPVARADALTNTNRWPRSHEVNCKGEALSIFDTTWPGRDVVKNIF